MNITEDFSCDRPSYWHICLLFQFSPLAGVEIAGAVAGSQQPSSDNPSPRAPTVTLHASQEMVAKGSQVALTWTSSNASICMASGGWSGPKDLTGSEQIAVLGETTYKLACSGTGGSTVAWLTVSTNASPMASIAAPAIQSVGSEVTLDGSGSSDEDGDPLIYTWSLTKSPAGSQAGIVSDSSANAAFTPDRPGTYEISLVVDDGLSESQPASTTIVAATPIQGVLQARTYDAADSPYMLTGRADVAPGTTVIFSEGTEIFGQDQQLRVFGTLRVAGSESRKMLLRAVHLVPGFGQPGFVPVIAGPRHFPEIWNAAGR